MRSSRPLSAPAFPALFAAVVATCGLARAADAPEVLRATGITSGLCVHVGTTDGAFEADAARSGTMLVQGLTLDSAKLQPARDHIKSAGLYGLASVQHLRDPATLPYAENLVNLLVADVDALGPKAPGEKEIFRILAPAGVAYLRKSGAWTKTVKPLPREMDEWQQYYHNAAMNPVSNDTLIAPSTSLKWISDYFEKGSSHSSNSGVILSGGKAIYINLVTSPKFQGPNAVLSCRDAYNGTLLWEQPLGQQHAKQSMLAVDGVIYCFKDKIGHMVAIDANTGELLRTFDKGGKWPGGSVAINFPTIYHKGLLIQACKDSIYVLDAATGDLKWKHTEQGKNVFFPTIGDDKLFFAAGPDKYDVWRAPSARIDAVHAFDLAKGTPVWTNPETAGSDFGQFCYHDGTLVIFSWKGIGGGKTNAIRCMDAKTGKTRWTDDYGETLSMGPPTLAIFRDGDFQMASLEGFIAYDPITGKRKKVVKNMPSRVGSYQCNTSRATTNYLITYSTVFLNNQGESFRNFISRSTCGSGVFPAYGMVYSTTNYCACHTMLRGYMAMASEPVGPVVDDAARLESGPAPVSFARPAESPRKDEWPTFMADSQRRNASSVTLGGNLRQLWQARVADPAKLPRSQLADDWLDNDQYLGHALAPVVANGVAVVAALNTHTLYAFDAATGAPRWNFTAGARVTTPTIYGNLCLVGSHDGYVYALNLADGTLAWRFLAAANTKQMGAYSQLESPWPVVGGVMIHDGAAFVSAGRHPDTDGGIHIYRLDPATGKAQWHSVYKNAPTPEGGKSPGNQVINDVPTTDGTTLYLKGLPIHPATGKFGTRPRLSKKEMDEGVKPSIKFEDGTAAPIKPYISSPWGLVTESASRSGAIGWSSNLQARQWALADGKAYGHRAGGTFLTCWSQADLFKGVDKESKSLWQNDEGRDPRHGVNTGVAALVATGDTLVVAGKEIPHGHLPGRKDFTAKAYVDLHSRTDGRKTQTLALPAPPTEKGVAVAYGRIYVASVDGTVTCFGEK